MRSGASERARVAVIRRLNARDTLDVPNVGLCSRFEWPRNPRNTRTPSPPFLLDVLHSTPRYWPDSAPAHTQKGSKDRRVSSSVDSLGSVAIVGVARCPNSRKPDNPMALRLSSAAKWLRGSANRYHHAIRDSTPSQWCGGADGEIRTHKGVCPTVCGTAAFTNFATPAPIPTANPGNPRARRVDLTTVSDRGVQYGGTTHRSCHQIRAVMTQILRSGARGVRKGYAIPLWNGHGIHGPPPHPSFLSSPLNPGHRQDSAPRTHNKRESRGRRVSSSVDSVGSVAIFEVERNQVGSRSAIGDGDQSKLQ